ncbi:MAG: TIGR01777 family oxidoreductase [Chlamydiales bacterium]|nr:TIGR01777 family oxidoreductase [Chlamydiales bacterium]
MTDSNVHSVSLRSPLTATAERIFDWHKQPGAFERLVPPWSNVKVTRMDSGLAKGNRLYLKVKKGFLTFDWVAEIDDVVEGARFSDTQIKGPFAYWHHEHRFQNATAGHCTIEDEVSYRVPGGFFGDALLDGFVCRDVDRLLAYRHSMLNNDLQAMLPFVDSPPQRVLISGTSGLIGAALIPFLQCAGHTVHRLVRSAPTSPTDVFWDPEKNVIQSEKLEKFDAIINLAGDNIASGRWTEAKKEKLRSSRVNSTDLLVSACANLTHPPKVFINASAIGFYGDRGNELVDESSSKGQGFLADLAGQWEHATSKLTSTRVVLARFGIVLSPKHGALKQMLTPFKFGLGGNLGNGEQFYSWIGIDDAVYSLYRALMDERLTGPVNVVSPHPVTNAIFTKTLGRVLNRPTLIPMPEAIVRLAFGEMGDALLLSSTRVQPKRLTDLLYPFAYADLETCLRHLLGATTPK